MTPLKVYIFAKKNFRFDLHFGGVLHCHFDTVQTNKLCLFLSYLLYFVRPTYLIDVKMNLPNFCVTFHLIIEVKSTKSRPAKTLYTGRAAANWGQLCAIFYTRFPRQCALRGATGVDCDAHNTQHSLRCCFREREKLRFSGSSTCRCVAQRGQSVICR